MWSGFYSCLGPQCFTTEGTPSQLHGICLIFALSATTAPAPATTVSNTKCSISPLISQLELCNVLLTYSKVGSSFLLVGLVLLYDLPIRSKRSFQIANAKYLFHSFMKSNSKMATYITLRWHKTLVEPLMISNNRPAFK